MSSKTRKLIWSVPLVATLAVVGALAVFVVLGLSNADPAQAQGTTPAAPSIRADLTKSGNGKISVGWTPGHNGGSDITGFELAHESNTSDSAPDPFVADATLSLDADVFTTEITLTNDDSTWYFVRVRAKNANGNGPWSMVSSGVQAMVVPPSAPQNVSAVEVSFDSIEITWTAPEDNGGDPPDGYHVRSMASGDGDPVTGTALTYTFDSLNPAEEYKISVLAVNSANTGGTSGNWSDPITVETKSKTETSIESTDLSKLKDSPGAALTIKLKLTLDDGVNGELASLPTGSSVVIFLEDDYQVPDSIATSAAYFTSSERDSGPPLFNDDDGTGSGGAPVYSTLVEVDTGDYYHVGDDAWSIKVTIPDMETRATQEITGAQPANRLDGGDVFTLNLSESSGIKNDKNAGTYKVGYQVLRPGESIKSDAVMPLQQLDGDDADSDPDNWKVSPKVSLSDESNKRDYELVIIGSGFNAGRKATAYVRKGVEGAAPPCGENFGGTSVGSGTVGTDHTVSIVDTVTTDDYTAGTTNYVCVRDDNSPDRRYAPTAKRFELESSIAAEPAEVNSGDEVTVKLRDFEVYDAMSVTLAGTKVWMGDTDGAGPDTDTDAFEVEYAVGAKELTFDMPGGLSGVIEISVDVNGTEKQTTITVTPSSLMLSKT